MEETYIINDWTSIPTIQEIIDNHIFFDNKQKIMPSFFGSRRRLEDLRDSYIIHFDRDIKDIISLYEENGFETKIIIQDPFGHKNPTVACPIGFPFNLPIKYDELVQFNKWICRVHIEICSDLKNNNIYSLPHIEPDPCFHPISHLIDTYLRGKVVYGDVAVKILNYFDIF